MLRVTPDLAAPLSQSCSPLHHRVPSVSSNLLERLKIVWKSFGKDLCMIGRNVSMLCEEICDVKHIEVISVSVSAIFVSVRSYA
jgi:hypothetical protein